jgi:hypothetical protein
VCRAGVCRAWEQGRTIVQQYHWAVIVLTLIITSLVLLILWLLYQ